MRLGCRCLLFLGAVIAAASAHGLEEPMPLPALESAESGETDDLDEDIHHILAASVDGRHADLSERVVNLGMHIDRFFGGERYDREARDSEMRLTLRSLLTDDGVDVDTRIRLRLALPNTERRLSLVLQSARDSLFDDPDDADVPPGARVSDDDEYFAGLRYVRRFAEVWGIDSDAGIKLRTPINPYVRVRGGRSWRAPLGEARLSQSIFWEKTEGPGVTTELLLQRDLRGANFLQAVTEATWLERKDRFFYRQTVALTHSFSDTHALQFRIGVNGESEPNDRVTSYYASLPWRFNIFRRWLFLELRPQVVFDRNDDFDAEPGLMVQLEGFFGERHVSDGSDPLAEYRGLPPSHPDLIGQPAATPVHLNSEESGAIDGGHRY